MALARRFLCMLNHVRSVPSSCLSVSAANLPSGDMCYQGEYLDASASVYIFDTQQSCKKTRDFTHVRNAWTYIDLPYVHRLAIVQNCLLWTHWMKSTPWRALLHCFSAKSWRVAATKQTTPTTLVCALRIWSMEWASSHGQMEGVMMESGCADLRSQIRTADKHTHTHARIFL
jgi:hypothetical protein